MIRALAALMRPGHWVKNVFVFAPLIFAQRLGDSAALGRTLAAFALFCAASSAVYVFNDIRDRDEDRRHPLKRHRPLAAGSIPIAAAWLLWATLGTGALAGALALGPWVATVLAIYLAINLLYSAGLKSIVILDVMIVAVGFVLRVLGGALAIDVEMSAWLLLCTIFLALFLVFSKRRHELVLLEERAPEQRRVLGRYSPAFLDQMINVVTASSVVSYALYTVERSPGGTLVYTVPFVLFGIFRYLYLVYQEPTERTPTEAVIRDVPSLINLLIWGGLVVLIFYG